MSVFSTQLLLSGAYRNLSPMVSIHLSETGRRHFSRAVQSAAALLSGFFVYYSITDSDIFWHLAAGREIITQKALLYHDPFSSTTPLAPWTDLHWLFQVFMRLCELAGGLRFLIFVKAAAVACAVAVMLFTFSRTAGSAIAAPGVALVIYYQRYLIPMRPIIVTLMMISLYIAMLERYCKDGKPFRLAAVLAAQVAWVNSQGLFMLGPVIAVSYGLGEYINHVVSGRFPEHSSRNTRLSAPRRRLLYTLPAALLAVSLINPWGWRAISFALRLFLRINPATANMYSQTIDENMPLFQMIGTPYASYVTIVLFCCVAAIVTCIMAARHVRFAHIFLASSGLLLAVMAQRNGILFTLLVLPLVLWNLSHAAIVPRKKYTAVLSITVAILISAALSHAFLHYIRLLHTWPGAISPFTHPTGSAPILKKLPAEGNLFNADRHGGYLLWHGYPALKVSSDTRLTLRSKEFYREYLALTEDPDRFDAYARRWNISRVVLPLAPISRYLPLAAYLYRHPRWRLVFTDGAEALFTAGGVSGFKPVGLDSPKDINGIMDSLRHRFSPDSPLFSEARGYLGRWCAAAGALSGAELALADCPTDECGIILADIRERQGRPADAERLLTGIIDRHPRNVTARLHLILFHLRAGHRERAVDELSKLLKKDPFNRAARNILFRLTGKRHLSAKEKR